ncbi:MAG: TIGR03546 family protein [Gammaproteobacteria bacterium]|nr:TIGR03546 family protein [Gammaproteobacteria bacterium]
MLNIIAKLLKVLNSEASPRGIAWSIALAFLFAALPMFSAAKWVVILIVAVTRVNLSSFIVFSALFALIAWLFDPLLNDLGLWLLTMPALQSFWLSVSNTAFGEALAINNTLALTTLLVGLISLVPLYFAGIQFVRFYRVKLMPRVNQWRIVTALKSTKLYQIYQSIA